jgi:hypothetical protein
MCIYCFIISLRNAAVSERLSVYDKVAVINVTIKETPCINGYMI